MLELLGSRPLSFPARGAAKTQRMVDAVDASRNTLLAALTRNLPDGVSAAFKAQDEARQKAAAAVCNIAHGLTIQLFGKPAYALHRQLFGESLGWQTKAEPAGAATR